MRPRLLDHAADNLGRTMPPRLSIDSNRFTLIDSGGNEKPINAMFLDVIFIDLNPKVSKMYFGRPYNPNDTEPPKCWSDNGVAPSAQALEPQHPACLGCAHNVVGSDISKFSGAKIKSCVDMKKLAFCVPPQVALPQGEGEMNFLHTVKPGSFKNWQTYINFLKAQKFTDGSSPDLSDVVTRLEFESQGVLKFSPVAPVPGNQALLAQRDAAWNKGTSGDIVGQNDVPYSAQIAAPAPVQQIAAPAGPFVPPPSAAGFVAQGLPSTEASATSAPAPAKRGRRKGATAENGFQAPAAPFAQVPAAQAPFMAQPNPPPATAAIPQSVQPPAPAQAADTTDIPDFLRRTQPTTPPPANPGFGMATPAAPDAAMQAAIAKAFALPT